MSSTLAPFGLRPAYHPSGTIRPDEGSIASGYGSNIFNGSPVAFANVGGTLVLAAAGDRALGAFQGVSYNTPAAGGRRVVSNYWPASTTATDIEAYYTSDPDLVYEIQADANITEASKGQCYDWTANTTTDGDLNTGNSTVALDVATLVTAGSAGLMVVGLSAEPDNAWSDGVNPAGNFPIVLVKIAEPVLGPSIPTNRV